LTEAADSGILAEFQRPAYDGDRFHANNSGTIMFGSEATIQALRDALRVSPDNLPLRQHLAETLLGLGRIEEAEQEYRQALASASDDDALKVGHELFEHSRGHRPCVLFFDEVDALAASRSDLRQSHGRIIINQFLAELDGVQSSNDGVLILAATNAPWHLDPAFRRPGRFDRILFVPPPDAPARAAILRLLCRGNPSQDVDYDHLAKKTDGFSGADLKSVMDVAVEQKLREAMKEGRPKPLTTRDLASSAAAIRPFTKEWFGTARNYALYSNQGGVYDDILKYLKM
jgi:tetratricopeptide (TPR) repeat protein